MKMVICGILPSDDSKVSAQIGHDFFNQKKKRKKDVKISLKFDYDSVKKAQRKKES